MVNETVTLKCLEHTTCIVLGAIQNGVLNTSDGQAVADYFREVYISMLDCAVLDKNDLEAKIRLLGTKKLKVNPV